MRNPFRSLMLLIAAILLSALTTLSAFSREWINPLATGAQVHGQGWSELHGTYSRLPQKAKGVVRDAVWNLSRNAAGLSLVFRSDSRTLTVRYQVEGGHSMFHMPSTGVSGVDLYAIDENGEPLWCAADFTPSFGDTIVYNYSGLEYSTQKKPYEYHLYLPLYNTVKWLEIGIDDGANLSFVPVSLEKPIVVWGTSIAQGACASRPGMAWTNIVERELEHPLVNLGFSGNGRLEAEMFTLLSEIDASLYVIDCMPNMQLTDSIQDLIIKGVGILRSRRSCPILLVEHSGYANEFTNPQRRFYRELNDRLRKAYMQLSRAGYQDIYYMTHDEIGMGYDGQVEGVHPNDLGMRRHADGHCRKIRAILREECQVLRPRKQNRDPYIWMERHESVLRLAAEKQPRVLLIGDSITHYWGGEPAQDTQNGPGAWEWMWKDENVLNLGFGWDRLENVLWRIHHGELDGYSAQDIYLLIGTNNMFQDTPEDIASGTREIVLSIRDRQPTARIHVLGILPRRGAEEQVRNQNLLTLAAISGLADFVDLGTAVTGKDGRIDEGLFLDGLHPNDKGYRKLCEELRSRTGR